MREALLDAAAREINLRGAAAVSLNALAEQLGLSRNALYYYVTDRSDLVFRAYLRTCETAADDLAIAFEEGCDAADSLRIYINRVLGSSNPPSAILTDIDFLPENQRETIADLNRRNTEALQAILNAGTTNGLFRPIDHEIIAQCIVGMLNWAQLSAAWLGYRDTAKVRARSAAAIIDILFAGLATEPAGGFVCPVELASLMARSFNAFDRTEATQEKATQVAVAAARLFNRKGLDGASLDEIGASLGATKGAVYHYFDDKTELVLSCYGRAFELYERILNVAEELVLSGLDRSLTVMYLNSEAQAGDEPPLILQAGLFSLPEAPRAHFIERSQRLWELSDGMLQSAIEDGSCRDCDHRMVATITAGAFMWIPKWIDQSSTCDPKNVAASIADFFAQGIVSKEAQLP
jgi:AcrR family transcriptional regulator